MFKLDRTEQTGQEGDRKFNNASHQVALTGRKIASLPSYWETIASKLKETKSHPLTLKDRTDMGSLLLLVMYLMYARTHPQSVAMVK